MGLDALAVVGLGAIGGSVAWQARAAGVARVVGFSPDPEEAAAAARAGAITEIADSPAAIVPVLGSAVPEAVVAASSSPQSSAVARPISGAARAPKTSCNPPYSIDRSGLRHYKKGCLR